MGNGYLVLKRLHARVTRSDVSMWASDEADLWQGLFRWAAVK